MTCGSLQGLQAWNKVCTRTSQDPTWAPWRIQTQIWKKTAPPRFDSYAGRRLGSEVFKVGIRSLQGLQGIQKPVKAT